MERALSTTTHRVDRLQDFLYYFITQDNTELTPKYIEIAIQFNTLAYIKCCFLQGTHDKFIFL